MFAQEPGSARSFKTSLSLLHVAIAAICIVLALGLRLRAVRKKAKYPPGPPADPIIGHGRMIPHVYPWKTFSGWAKTYGDLVYASVLGRRILIFSSVAAAHDLMDKKGVNYSDRPRLVFINEMMGSYCLVQRQAVMQLSDNFMGSPERFRTHIHTGSAQLVKITYGHDVKSDDDKYVRAVERSNAMVVESGSSGATSVDFFPLLRYTPSWIPGVKFKKYAVEAHKAVKESINMPFEEAQKCRAVGTAQPSFLNSLLEEYDASGVVDAELLHNIKHIAASVCGVVNHPDVAKRAQAEIDNVVGRVCLPNLQDRSQLPYIDCIMQEAFRVNPPVPLGHPHTAVTEDTYRGMTIPAGTMILPNIWHMLRDERTYPEPECFYPERPSDRVKRSTDLISRKQLSADVLAGDDEFDPVYADYPSSLVFGFGRRICPGCFLADKGIWLAMACILAVFGILPPLDPETGEEKMPQLAFKSGTTSHPQPYSCRIVLRSPEYAALIRQELS